MERSSYYTRCYILISHFFTIITGFLLIPPQNLAPQIVEQPCVLGIGQTRNSRKGPTAGAYNLIQAITTGYR